MLYLCDLSSVGVRSIGEDPALQVITVTAADPGGDTVRGQDHKPAELTSPLRGLLRLVPANDHTFFSRHRFQLQDRIGSLPSVGSLDVLQHHALVSLVEALVVERPELGLIFAGLRLDEPERGALR